MKLGIAIPTPQFVSPDFAIGNLQELLAYTRKNVTNEISIRYQGGVRTDRNRNVCVKALLEDGCDYILHLDADMLYPADIVERYLTDTKEMQLEVDVIGSYYFKRSEPYSPIGYVKNEKDNKNTHPYTQIPPQRVVQGVIYEVDGIGFGGMMVSKKVYDKLGGKKWSVYGKNFHIPETTTNQLTHDLMFCKAVKDAGMSVKMHGSVRPKHIGTMLVDENTYINSVEADVDLDHLPKVMVIMPVTDKEQAKKTVEVMKARAGMPCDILAVIDQDREGFVSICNKVVESKKDYNLYVYTAQDAFVGENWLFNAVSKYIMTGAGVVAFNSGKWGGELPQFGLVSKDFIENVMDGHIFHPGYKANYCDVELGQVAKQHGLYAYAETAIMMEVDHEKVKGNKSVSLDDKKLYKKRALKGFDGKVTSDILLKQFA